MTAILHLPDILIPLCQPILHGSVIADFPTKPVGYGHGLPFIYAMWILAVAILYMPCLWFMELRSRHRIGLGYVICDGHLNLPGIAGVTLPLHSLTVDEF
jgi:hypothetical protein